tara:strand:+ start:629 stop:913 length:285 start_codon:yes stop_codon:yes gene_type:complete
MIDTDKYEGHDLAKGRVGSDYNIYDRKGNIIFDADDVGSNMATLNLLADAPLLLAEVKRLREALLRIADTANGRPFISGHMDSFVGEVLKELIE